MADYMKDYCGICFQPLIGGRTESIGHVARNECGGVVWPPTLTEITTGEIRVQVEDGLGDVALDSTVTGSNPDAARQAVGMHIVENHVEWNGNASPVKCTCSYFSCQPNNDSDPKETWHGKTTDEGVAVSSSHYLYVVVNFDSKTDAYKVGQSKGLGRVICDFLKYGWELVALWDFPDFDNAYAAEQEVLRFWRTSGFPIHCSFGQVKQGGATETVWTGHFGSSNASSPQRNLKVIQEVTGVINRKPKQGNINISGKDIKCVSGSQPMLIPLPVNGHSITRSGLTFEEAKLNGAAEVFPPKSAERAQLAQDAVTIIKRNAGNSVSVDAIDRSLKRDKAHDYGHITHKEMRRAIEKTLEDLGDTLGVERTSRSKKYGENLWCSTGS